MKRLLPLIAFGLLQASFSFSASEGPTSPTGARSSDQSLGSLIVWSNVTRSTSSNDSYATAVCDVINGDFSEYLIVSTFSFVLVGCSSVTTITAEIEKKTAGSIIDNSVKLVVAGSVSGIENKDGSAWPGSDAYTTYTWSANLPTCAQVQDNAFGLGISATRGGGAAPTASVDHVRMTISYNGTSNGIQTQGVYWGGVGTK
jgi:hypothetical protein